MTLELLAANALAVFCLLTLLWVVSVVRRDASLIDPWWSVLFLLVTVLSVKQTGVSPTKLTLLAMVSVWALRLWAHLLWRSRGKPEDPRYAAFRVRYGAHRYWWVSYFQVFLLQGALALVISAPLVLIASDSARREPGLFELLGGFVFTVGFLIEVVADAQLARFRGDASQRGQVLRSGLWGRSRHPNYFGEAVLWWGFWIASLSHPLGWVTVFAPLLMTFLLVKVSGVSMLDAHMTATRPGYAEYIRDTPALVPRLTSPGGK